MIFYNITNRFKKYGHRKTRLDDLVGYKFSRLWLVGYCSEQQPIYWTMNNDPLQWETQDYASSTRPVVTINKLHTKIKK